MKIIKENIILMSFILSLLWQINGVLKRLFSNYYIWIDIRSRAGWVLTQISRFYSILIHKLLIRFQFDID